MKKITLFVLKMTLWLSVVFTSYYANPVLAKTINSHAVAMHGSPKYLDSFTHFDYSSPNALKGGELTLGLQGTFDSLNPFIAKGNSADNISLIYDTLTVSSADEAFTRYGLIAHRMEYPEDRSWIIFHLRPEARFHDGQPIRSDDVVYSFNLLMKHGSPIYQSYYSQVETVKALSPLSVKFSFKPGENHELALIVGELAVLPKHYWQNQDFATSSLEIPLGSGPYSIKNFDAGRQIVYQRNEQYWAKDLAVNKGMYNFDTIKIDYYKDAVVLLEALKAGQYDFRLENYSKQWATGYTGDALDKGELVREQIPHELPTGMQAFLLNQRNPLFKDIKVREALNYAFNFEWSNKNLFYDAYTRSQSYFSNSELAATGLPSAAELEILEPYRSQLPSSVFNSVFTLPKSTGDKYNRANLLKAKKLLRDAGWRVKNNQLVNKNNTVFSFEILLVQPSFERIVNPMIKSLQKLGIQASVRHVEVSQYINLMRDFDYDVVVGSFGQSLSPGNEQIDYWHSSKANVKASRNWLGIKNPVIDDLIDLIVKASDRQSLITRTRALDRVLLNHYYVIPQWHIGSHRIAYWNKFERPSTNPKYDPNYQTALMTWWAKSAQHSTTKTEH